MVAKLKSFWHTIKALYNAIIARIIWPLVITGLIGIALVQHSNIQNLKKQNKQIIQQYRDSLAKINKTCNLYLQDVNIMTMRLNQFQEQTYEVIGKLYELQSQVEHLSSEKVRCTKESQRLQIKINALLREINSLKRKADALAERKH